MHILKRLFDEKMWIDAVDDAAEIIRIQDYLIKNHVRHDEDCASLRATLRKDERLHVGVCSCGLVEKMKYVNKKVTG